MVHASGVGVPFGNHHKIRLSLACRSQHAVALSLPSQLTSGTHGEHVTSFVAAPLMNVHRRAAAGMVDIAPGMISRSIR